MIKKSLVFLILYFIWISVIYGESTNGKQASAEDKIKIEPPAIGNFTLPTSQQPGSLFGFGQNVIGQGQRELLFSIGYTQGPNAFDALFVPSFIYAFTDELSIDLFIPITVRAQSKQNRSAGIGDFVAQFEYALYHRDTYQFVDEGTIVLSLSAPTGSIDKNPETGLGYYSIFSGFTFIRTYIDWLWYTSHGVISTIAHQGTKSGSVFIYQAGIGKNICYAKDKYIFNWLIEISGIYTQQTRQRGILDPNTGGNLVFVAPSIWYSNKNFQFQFGLGVPVTQHYNGDQPRTNYLILTTFGWTF